MTMRWVAIINTDQEQIDSGDSISTEDNDSIVALSFATEQEAREACYAYAPPRMYTFDECTNCYMCRKKFNKFLRRPFNCQNCGISICLNCATNWPSTMLPETFTLKHRRRSVKICLACDWLNDSFRMSLVNGDYKKALALHSTGNINLRSPFAKGNHETYYPVHCAVVGGKLPLLKWMVESHCCPINPRKRHSKHDTRYSSIGNEAIVTSKGRSVLEVAMETNLTHILRYLVVEKKMNIMLYRNLDVALRNLAFCLKQLPEC
mmetsp:Transcript_23036/g.28255  ORF Transcript_23036/g.28255 Transcript_23036/m.28255 type:complete len:263 (-) Transcript_23036:847-1635(-)